MQRLIILTVAALLVIGVTVPVFKAARAAARKSTTMRVVLLVVSAGVQAGAITLVPWIGRLRPPWSESPAGLFVILFRLALVGGGGLVAAATLLGAIFSGRGGANDD
jgi:hypothetical protein